MPPPNILWIVTTQWRAQACGYAGDRNAFTPSLDALAARSGNFAEAVTPHPFGPLARAALLSGLPSPQNGVADYWDPLPPDTRTIAHALAERDYATAFIGKWGVGRRDRTLPIVGEAAARILVAPEDRGGFAHWLGFEGGFQLNAPWLHGTGRPRPERVPGYQSDILVDEALRYWAKETARARFLLLSLEAPHPPYGASVPDAGPSPEPALLQLAPNVPRGGEIERRARRELAGYYRHIAATDRALGRLFDALERQANARRRRTILVFTSVHGDMHGAHGLFRKGWPHEESIRVPLLVSEWPRNDAGPWRSDAPVSLIDLVPMTLAWADKNPWECRVDAAAISMPCVVALPDQCPHPWKGKRRPGGQKEIHLPDGSPWILDELVRKQGEAENGTR